MSNYICWPLSPWGQQTSPFIRTHMRTHTRTKSAGLEGNTNLCPMIKLFKCVQDQNRWVCVQLPCFKHDRNNLTETDLLYSDQHTKVSHSWVVVSVTALIYWTVMLMGDVGLSLAWVMFPFCSLLFHFLFVSTVSIIKKVTITKLKYYELTYTITVWQFVFCVNRRKNKIDEKNV